jgi:hypothetical protein
MGPWLGRSCFAIVVTDRGLCFHMDHQALNLRRMTKLLEQGIEAVRRLPADAQDDIARTILHLAGTEATAEPTDPAHLRAVLEGLAQAKRREFATDDEIEAAFRRFDR